jgi:hypothetical protein
MHLYAIMKQLIIYPNHLKKLRIEEKRCENQICKDRHTKFFTELCETRPMHWMHFWKKAS